MSQRRVNAPVLIGWPATSLQLENNRIIQPLAPARGIIHNRSCQGIAWLGSELWGDCSLSPIRRIQNGAECIDHLAQPWSLLQ